MRSCNIIFNIYTEDIFSLPSIQHYVPFPHGNFSAHSFKKCNKEELASQTDIKSHTVPVKICKKILQSTIKTENKLLRSSGHTKKGWLFWQTRSNQITLKNVVMCIMYARTKGQYLCIWCTCPCMQSFLKLEKICTCF